MQKGTLKPSSFEVFFVFTVWKSSQPHGAVSSGIVSYSQFLLAELKMFVKNVVQ